NRLGFGLERDDHDHRPENLLVNDAHTGLRVGEDRRAEEEPFAWWALATTDIASSFLTPQRHVALSPLPLARGDERSHLGLLVQWIADPHRLCDRRHRFDQRGICLLLDDDPGPSAAVLPGIGEYRSAGVFRRLLQIHIRKDDVWGLSAQLERDPFDGLGSRRHDASSGLGFPGKRYFGDVRMTGHLLADAGPGPRNDIQHSRREAGFESQFSE